MAKHLVVSPAYGKDYPPKETAVQGWNDNKDFVHESRPFTGNGTYLNKADLERLDPDATVQIRFNQKVDLVVVNVNVTLVEGETLEDEEDEYDDEEWDDDEDDWDDDEDDWDDDYEWFDDEELLIIAVSQTCPLAQGEIR